MIKDTESEIVKKSLFQASDLAYNITDMSKNLEREIENLKIWLNKRDSMLRRQNPYIVKSIMKYMSGGLNCDDACVKAADEYNTTVARVKSIFSHEKIYLAAVNLYARSYMCQKLKKAGMPASEISHMLGISTNHVYKLLKAKINLD